MQRAAGLLRKLKLPAGLTGPEDIARVAWPAAVGRKIADRTRVAAVVRKSLVIEVEDQVWQRQLNALRYTILDNLRRVLGDRLEIEDIDFRPMPPKRQPQRAESAAGTPARDESAAIADPVLQRVYRLAKRKASA